MYKVRLVLLTAVCMFIFGCDSDLMDAMNRVARDPEISPPRAVSFEQELSIQVLWDEDEAADEYILRRAEDTGGVPVYSTVYEGTGRSYTDTAVEDEKRYLYTLAKLKGNTEFGPSEPALGIGNECIKDLHEPNDTKDSAFYFTCNEVSISCNSYYYQQSGGTNWIQDDDWFYVVIDPGHRLTLKVVQQSPAIGVDGSCLRYLREGAGSSEQITSDQPFSLDNELFTEASFRFRIFPDPAVCIDEAPLAGGTVIEYTLVFVSDSPIPHSDG